MPQMNYVYSKSPHLGDGSSQQSFLGLTHFSSMGR